MATRIEHRATYAHGTAEVFAAQTDERALRARLERLGGTNAEITAYEAAGAEVRYTLVQGIDAARLPSVVRTAHSGDLLVRRTHTWKADGAEHYSGTVDVRVGDLPARLSAETELTLENDVTVLRTLGEVTVRVPLMGGKIERVVAEQVTTLLEHEADYTAQWLAGRA